MEIELATLSDLENLKREILTEIKTLLLGTNLKPEKKWMKSGEVQKLLGISPGTLQTLRNRDMIPFTRLGGMIFYEQTEINKLLGKKDLDQNFNSAKSSIKKHFNLKIK